MKSSKRISVRLFEYQGLKITSLVKIFINYLLDGSMKVFDNDWNTELEHIGVEGLPEPLQPIGSFPFPFHVRRK